MKAIARGYAYWPGMDKYIEGIVKDCPKCQLAGKGPPRENPIPWPETKKPWSRVHVDFAGPINGVTYLVLVDSHSKWPEVMTMPSTSASATISALDKIFSTHGLPETIVSDNGTQFTSAQFNEYCKSHAIEHIRSPPYHPQSNGQAEKFVNPLKRVLLKIKEEGGTEESIRRFLITYRTSIHPKLNGKSPAEVLMGRTIRTINHAMLPGTTSSKSKKLLKQVTFNVSDPVLARDFRPGQT